MVIFHSYVSLPEGNDLVVSMLKATVWFFHSQTRHCTVWCRKMTWDNGPMVASDKVSRKASTAPFVAEGELTTRFHMDASRSSFSRTCCATILEGFCQHICPSSRPHLSCEQPLGWSARQPPPKMKTTCDFSRIDQIRIGACPEIETIRPFLWVGIV